MLALCLVNRLSPEEDLYLRMISQKGQLWKKRTTSAKTVNSLVAFFLSPVSPPLYEYMLFVSACVLGVCVTVGVAPQHV